MASGGEYWVPDEGDDRHGLLRRRWPWLAGLAALAVVAAALAVGMWVNAQRAQWWLTQAADRQAEADELSDQLDGTRDELATVADNLAAVTDELATVSDQLATVSDERDVALGEVAELEARLRTLSNEIAVVEDERELAIASAEQLAELTRLAGEVGTRLNWCIDDLVAWIVDQPSFSAPDWEWDAWTARSEPIADACAQARQDFDGLRAAIGDL